MEIMKVTILQWNVWFREQADNVMALIQETDADILCLQELTEDSTNNPGRNIPDELSKLGYSSFYQRTLKRPGYTMGNGIFSKFPIANTRHVYVQHEDPNSTDYSKENRIYVEVTVSVGGVELVVGTVHLSYSPSFSYSKAKELESDQLIEAVSSNTSRYVLTGDLNALPDSKTVAKLERILKIAGPDYEVATWTTKPFSYDGFEAKGLNWRLDYVFTTPDVKVTDSKTLKTEVSDHLPILTTIEL
jgi:endonuclease/exonuclease/phosphatase family metal-dependent hydrolase